MKNTSLLTIVAGIILFSACSEKLPENEKTQDYVCVKTEVVHETASEVPIRYPGILSTKQVIRLSFKTGGIIERFVVNEGAFVKKGQLLATLDMTEIASQVSQARLGFEKASRDLERVENLYADTVATLEQLQDATSAYEAAAENKTIAEFNLNHSKITAPADGRIIAKLAEEHELTGPGMPVLVFSEQGNEQWILKTGLSDRDVVKIRLGDKAEVVFDAFPRRTFLAHVSQVAEMADPQTGTFEVEVTVDPQNEKFINGLIAKITIQSVPQQNVAMVPPEAITNADGNKGYVFVVQPSDTTAKKIPVTIAYLENDYVAVADPVLLNDEVITEGASFLEDGSKISIIK